MRNPLARLARRDPTKPSLRERAAALKVKAAKVLKRRPAGSPGDERPPFALDRGDEHLLALEAEFQAADDAVAAASAALYEAEDAHVEPAMPRELRPWRGDWMHTQIPRAHVVQDRDGRYRSLPYDAEQVEQMRGLRCMRRTYSSKGEIGPDGFHGEPDTQVQQRVDGIVAAWDAWQADRQAAEEALNLPALREACEAARGVRLDLLERIRGTSALSLVGLGAKARIAAVMNGEDNLKADGLRSYDADEPAALPFDIAGDVLALTGGLRAA